MLMEDKKNLVFKCLKRHAAATNLLPSSTVIAETTGLSPTLIPDILRRLEKDGALIILRQSYRGLTNATVKIKTITFKINDTRKILG